MKLTFWRKQVFLYVFLGCGLFFILTLIAMLTYPGGLYTGELTTGYDFFRNLFSDLGRITVEGGRSNAGSALLFFLALSIAGIGLIFFFLAFRGFFTNSRTGRNEAGMHDPAHPTIEPDSNIGTSMLVCGGLWTLMLSAVLLLVTQLP